MIYQFGVLPILLILIYKLWQKIGKLEKEAKEKNLEIREIEKENIGLLYKSLAAIKKLKGDEGE